ncbi:hypothetical protein [Mycolicibacterium aubagnense]|uniref:PE domain-containing protein n=1 Tax=Mycolicibacterium aubagnense TaxID=319707 RepID=A0ABN5Z209_9MYCO|nr:hypothetical protein [Mycolicibacterium aubagnense]TLH62759.1 hypothetical protein C1S80_15045 [Mycolicibacterium aubagnense]BBX88145.1 hypothetical protein MAUB_63460 [Mycolicibacterium aubagnense]
MPYLAQRDATQLLPQIAPLGDLLDHYRDATEQFAASIYETTAVRGATRDALVRNAEEIEGAGARMHGAASRRINGLRESLELGVRVTAEGAAHIRSVEIPAIL